MKTPLFTAFPLVWLIAALGSTLYLRSLSAVEKRALNSRVTLLALGVICGFMVLIALAEGVWLPAAVLLAFGIGICYLSITKSRLCEPCNRNLQPTKLVTPVEFCPRCGAKTVPYDRPFA